MASVVYHPKKTDLDELRSIVARIEAEAGWAPTQWHPTTEEDTKGEVAQNALAEGANVVLASGGDGTVRGVSQALRGTGVPLAIVPQGTGNLLARNIGMPLNDLEAAVRAAFFGENRPVDLGHITITREDQTEDEHGFLVLAGMGLDARMISITRKDLKKRMGWLAYVDAGVRTFLKDKPLEIRYSLDRGPRKHLRVYTVMIGNCGLMPGGVLLIPDAKLDDGRLDVVALRPLGPFSWLSIWRKIGWENGVLRKTKAGRQMIDLINDTRSVTYATTTGFALSVGQPEPIQLDGDDLGLAIAARGRVDPGALTLRVDPAWQAPVWAPDAEPVTAGRAR